MNDQIEKTLAAIEASKSDDILLWSNDSLKAVAAELRRYQAMMAAEPEIVIWTKPNSKIRPDDEVVISQFHDTGPWTWFDSTGKVLPNAPLFDSPLDAFESLSAQEEGK